MPLFKHRYDPSDLIFNTNELKHCPNFHLATLPGTLFTLHVYTSQITGVLHTREQDSHGDRGSRSILEERHSRQQVCIYRCSVSVFYLL